MINKDLKIALFSFAALFILSMIYLVFAFIFNIWPFYYEDFGRAPRRPPPPPPVPNAPCLGTSIRPLRLACTCWCRHQFNMPRCRAGLSSAQWEKVTSLPPDGYSPRAPATPPLAQCINQCESTQNSC